MSSAQSRGSLKTNMASILRDADGVDGEIGRGSGRVLPGGGGAGDLNGQMFGCAVMMSPGVTTFLKP